MASRASRPARVEHTGRTTTKRAFSRATLEFCDWLIDGVTLAANHPDFEGQSKIIASAKKEVAAALTEQGGIPIAVKREREQQPG